jgi:hypothetical protein
LVFFQSTHGWIWWVPSLTCWTMHHSLRSSWTHVQYLC